jgi:hypothetical protein
MPTASPTMEDTIKLDMALELYGERKVVCAMALNNSASIRVISKSLCVCHVCVFLFVLRALSRENSTRI